jgi:hypothetical protein
MIVVGCQCVFSGSIDAILVRVVTTTNATSAATRVNDNGACDINIDDDIDIKPHVGGEVREGGK